MGFFKCNKFNRRLVKYENNKGYHETKFCMFQFTFANFEFQHSLLKLVT